MILLSRILAYLAGNLFVEAYIPKVIPAKYANHAKQGRSASPSFLSLRSLRSLRLNENPKRPTSKPATHDPQPQGSQKLTEKRMNHKERREHSAA